MPMFAVLTFRRTGPIKTWSAMEAANVHNARTKPLAHAVAGAPAPVHLIGGRDLAGAVKATLRRLGLDPDAKRKNGVLAYEAVLSASPEFFERGDEADRRQRLTVWAAATKAWALKHYGAHRVVSMVLHQDEKTPHIHLVVAPLDVKQDKRRKGSGARWSLVGRLVSGPGQFRKAHDSYAEAIAGFGLVRGERDSGRKHEPVSVYLARLAEKERAADFEIAVATATTAAATRDAASLRAEAALQRDEASRERTAAGDLLRGAADERAAAAKSRREADTAAKALEEEGRLARRRIAEQELLLEGERQALAAARAHVERREAAVEKQRVEAADGLADAFVAKREAKAMRDEATAERGRANDLKSRLEDYRTRLRPVIATANDFHRRIGALGDACLTESARATATAADRLRHAVRDMAGERATPAGTPHPATIDSLRATAAARAAGMDR